MIYHKQVTTKIDTATLTLAEMGDIIVSKITAFTITLPTAVGHKGLWYTIINAGSGVCTIATLASLDINDSVYLISDGTSWHKIITRSVIGVLAGKSTTQSRSSGNITIT